MTSSRHQPHPKPAQSPYRIVQHETGHDAAVNRFLDGVYRCLADDSPQLRNDCCTSSLVVSVHQTEPSPKRHTESTCSNMSVSSRPVPACSATINRRIVVAIVRSKRIPNAPASSLRLSSTLLERSPMSGHGAPGLKPLRVKAPNA